MTLSRTTIVLLLAVVPFAVASTVAENDVRQDTSTVVPGNSTAPSDSPEPMPKWAGFIGCLVASVFFGSNLLPVKQFSAGDGFFFQFIFCVAVWLVGLVLDIILNNQRFYPLVLIGGEYARRLPPNGFATRSTISGVLWTTGNLVTVFCIKTCGLAVGLLIWGTTSLIVGWAGGRFGFFGVKAQIPPTAVKLGLNYTSVVLAAISAIFFLFIESNTTTAASATSEGREASYSASSDDRSMVSLSRLEKAENKEEDENIDMDFPFLNKMSDRVQKILGCALAAMAGIFYGLMFIPDQYIRDHAGRFTDEEGRSPPANGLYYINSQYSGVLLSSLFYFVVYAALKRNKPVINPVVALPALASGAMWGIANIGFIVAISALSSAVAYPIVSVLPGIVTSLWSLFLFREIQGKRNYLFLSAGMLVRILAAILSGLSA